MQIIDTFQENEAYQNFEVKLADGSVVDLTVWFDSTSTQCFYMNIKYGDIQVNGVKVVSFYSLLGTMKNRLPFDIGCLHQARIDPSDINDFVNGYAELFIGTHAEIEELRNLFYAN